VHVRTSNLLTAVAIALSLSLAAGAAAAKDWSRIRIATEGAYPPWNFTDVSGQLIGFEVDLAKDLCRRMKATCEIVAQDWEGIIPALQAGKYDAIMDGMPITAERRQMIDFSDSYWNTPTYFAVRKDSDLAKADLPKNKLDLSALDPQDEQAIAALKKAFEGKSIGVQVATVHQAFLDQYLAEAADIRRYDTLENLDLDLQAGRVDAALADLSDWHPLLQTDKGKDFTLIGPGLTRGPLGEGVGVGLRQDDEDLRAMFNKAIAAARADGTISRIGQRWFGFDASG
jgi:octopine/nopaline transport system substrate-binding protein